MSDALILSIDTTAAHCAAALLSGDRVLAHRFETMAKGQAERLMPLVEEILAATKKKPADLTLIAVCTGPGNFTGIRIAVAAARGLALSLGIPAIGVSRLQALAHGVARPVTAVLDGRGGVFAQTFHDGDTSGDPVLVAAADLTPDAAFAALYGDLQQAALSRCTGVPAKAIVLHVAAIAAKKSGSPQPRPAPVYVRAPNAALPSDPPPTLLP